MIQATARPFSIFAVLVTTLILAIPGGNAAAALLIVKTVEDVVAVDGHCSLREAIINANDNAATHDDCAAGDAAPDNIEFDAGLAGESIILGSQLPTITEALNITGPLASDSGGLTLDAGQDSRIFFIVGQSVGGPNQFQVDLTGLTLTNGKGQGGAAAALNAGLNLENVFVTGNIGTATGGGLYVGQGNLTLIDSVVSDNSTSGPFESGGGIRVNNQTFNGEVELINSTISNNSTKGDNAVGGGIYVTNSTVTLTGSTVSNNSTSGAEAGGGGLYVKDGNAVLEDSTVSGNSTMNGSGGGLFIDGDATLTGSTISGNSVKGEEEGGAGLLVEGNAQLINTTVSGNSAAKGGGGGLEVYGSATTLRHSTIAFNTTGANSGSDGLFVLGTLDLENSLIVQEDAGEDACNKQADSELSSLATDDSCTGTATALADINLGPLASNGGPTQTHALLEPSVAINAAGSGICNSLSPIEDQRGVPRPANAIDCDIGAYEVATDFDMGDAPDADPQDPGAMPPLSYPTLLANNGAAHMPVDGPRLGALIDLEGNGQPTADADGDDLGNTADEDGVVFTFTPLEAGMDATVDVTVMGGPGLLNAWIDFNADGDWQDAGEQIFIDEPLVDGSNAGLMFPVSEEIVSGETFARFRLSTVAGLTPEGIAVDGEVEDYKVAIAPPTVMFNSKRDNPKLRENKGMFVVKGAVLLSNPSSQEVTVDIVFDAGASDADIPADFDFSPATVVFAPGETSADVEITIVDDDVEESDEIAVFNLANPVNASLGSLSTFTATLKDPKKGGGGSSSGCVMGRPGGPADPLLPLLMLLAVTWVVRKRRDTNDSMSSLRGR